MANGAFLGGFAEGSRNAQLLDLSSRELDIKAEAIRGARDRALTGEIDKVFTQNVSTITDIINKSRAAGAPPDKIRATIAPLIQGYQSLATRVGRDIQPSLLAFDALLGVPGGPESEASPSTEIGKLRNDLQRGFITSDEFSQRVARLTREPAETNAVETIRRKLASGESLTPGEQRVYDDAIRSDVLANILRGTVGGGGGTPAPAPAAPPRDPAGIRR